MFLHLISRIVSEKALNKSIKFVINRKSVSTSQNEEFLEKYDFTGPEKN